MVQRLWLIEFDLPSGAILLLNNYHVVSHCPYQKSKDLMSSTFTYFDQL